MSATPRLRSAFPATPQTVQQQQQQQQRGARSPGSPGIADISSLDPAKPAPPAPLLSFEIIDAPSQRLYAAGIFALLWTWRLYDWSNLMADESESLWLFMKWLVLDLSFLYFLEAAHIPWLEFGVASQTLFFSVHAVFNALLMFRIPINALTWLGALANYVWDSELAISGSSVKYSSIINNPSLIQGRQTIIILPQGSATLNPDRIPLCLDNVTPKHIPLLINQTTPISIELELFSLDTPEKEIISIPAAQAKKLRRDALKKHHGAASDTLTLEIPVKQTGLYRLSRIVDETKMDVQLRLSSDALVVKCPTASIVANSHDRCKGDLSNIWVDVEGTPPLQIKYRKTVNRKDYEKSYQSVQPDDFVSPMLSYGESGPLVLKKGDPDATWAAPRRVKLSLNETLEETGRWIYSMDSVTDALNNDVPYVTDESFEGTRNTRDSAEASLEVHDRLRVRFHEYDLQKPVLVRKNKEANFPVRVTTSKDTLVADAQVTIKYMFTPIDAMPHNGEHGVDPEILEITMKSSGQPPKVVNPGLYSLLSISTRHCRGEVFEPSAFMLINPPEPSLAFDFEEITDQCEGKAVGSLVHLDLTGTPPFVVTYTVKKGKAHVKTDQKTIRTLRGQIELKPDEAEAYEYTFTEISDSVYQRVPLTSQGLSFSQVVKPAPFAEFTSSGPESGLCIDQTAQFSVRFRGEGPWSLEYEIVYGGRRTKQIEPRIERDSHTITTPPLGNGGDYSIVLTGVTDTSRCKKALQQHLKVHVRHQRPKAAFGHIEGQRSVQSLEGRYVKIPLRLQGEGPWMVNYRYSNGGKPVDLKAELELGNDFLSTKNPGRYELVAVHDKSCPGTIDEAASTFDIQWIQRPAFKMSESQVVHLEGDSYTRSDICEGEEDAMDLALSGKPPFDITYVESVTYENGKQAKQMPVELLQVLQSVAHVKMDSSQAGLYEYTFNELGDYNYDHVAKKHTPLKIKQRVHGRPTGTFASPGKVYSVCQSQLADQPDSKVEKIPFKFLTGTPPFSLELELTRPGKAVRPEPISFTNIETRDYDIELSSSRLRPGNSILTVRRIRDSKNCERIIDPSHSPRVQVSVHDLPNIQAVEGRSDYCVGDRIAFSISGVAPFTIFYEFEGKSRKATEVSPTFRRLAESPGNFTITGLQDSASSCRRDMALSKHIHPMPSVRVSKGKESRVDIHAGGEADIQFDFGGTPQFEFTYIRTENLGRGDGAGGGKKRQGALLESKTLVSDEGSMTIKSSDEGTYEVVAIRDRYCSFIKPGMEAVAGGARKLLKNG